MARSTARKRALNTLYEADEKGQDILSLLSERIAEPGAQTPLPDYAIQIVRGVAEEQEGIDKALEARSVKWPLKRMAVVDRNILRIAAWEMLFNDEVPDRVTIDEALSLAKTLSDDDSPAFIHGLLSAVCEDKESVLVDINAAHEANAAQKAEHEAEERRLNSPTAPVSFSPMVFQATVMVCLLIGKTPMAETIPSNLSKWEPRPARLGRMPLVRWNKRH